jgi:hypothetical protein
MQGQGNKERKKVSLSLINLQNVSIVDLHRTSIKSSAKFQGQCQIAYNYLLYKKELKSKDKRFDPDLRKKELKSKDKRFDPDLRRNPSLRIGLCA